MVAAHVIVLAPARPPQGTAAARVARLLARADHQAAAALDDRALYGDLFTPVPAGWPIAGVSRQADAGDADDHAWLRADPAHLRVETGHVRLLACGDIGQDPAEAAALVASLAPLFGDEGFELSATASTRWYLRPFVTNAAPDLPDLPAPEAALGGDLFELWPENDNARRWRGLFSQAQILLAQHPVNRARVQAGRPAINGLWFHGAGRLPKRVVTVLSRVESEEPGLRAWARAAGIAPDTDTAPTPGQTVLIDLRGVVNADARLAALIAAWDAGRVATLEWRAPQARWLLRRWHRWRFWR